MLGTKTGTQHFGFGLGQLCSGSLSVVFQSIIGSQARYSATASADPVAASAVLGNARVKLVANCAQLRAIGCILQLGRTWQQTPPGDPALKGGKRSTARECPALAGLRVCGARARQRERVRRRAGAAACSGAGSRRCSARDWARITSSPEPAARYASIRASSAREHKADCSADGLAASMHAGRWPLATAREPDTRRAPWWVLPYGPAVPCLRARVLAHSSRGIAPRRGSRLRLHQQHVAAAAA